MYGDATLGIFERRTASAEHAEAFTTVTALDRPGAKIRMLELEIAPIEEHELTLPSNHTPGIVRPGGMRSGGAGGRWPTRAWIGTRHFCGGGYGRNSPSDCGSIDETSWKSPPKLREVVALDAMNVSVLGGPSDQMDEAYMR